MNRFKKAISVGMSATLLASLFTVIAAGTALGAVTVTSAGNVPVGGTSAGSATFLFVESSATGIPTNAAGGFDVVIAPAAPGLGAVTFSGTPVVSAPGSLGASASITGSTLSVAWTNSDTANIESISVSGLFIDAAAGTSTGAITATMGNFSGNMPGASAFVSGGTATGTLAVGAGAGATNVIVNVTSGACIFVTTPPGGNLSFATSPETKAVSAAPALGVDGPGPGVPGAGQQDLTIAATANVHNAGEVVSQTTACGASPILGSPGTVVAALTYNNPSPKAIVFPGENNSPATNLVLVEPALGFLPAASTFTYTIATAGVVFSTAPTVSDNNAVMVLSAPVLSADRKSATVTVTTASTVGPATITLSNILYDVASTVPGGTLVSVGVATSGSLAVLPASRTNALVFRGIAAVSATTPTVYIGENSQAAGLISFTENGAGFFTDGTGPNNTFTICPVGVTYAFTLAPWARVSGGVAAGNLILREGAGASPDNIVQGTQVGACFMWTVWTKSTTASTIQIGNSDFASGPIINVNVNQPPGAVMVDLFIGDGTIIGNGLAATVQFATATFRNQVTVTALGQPVITKGATSAAAGNIQIAETGLGQLKNGEWLCVEVLPRALTTGTGTIQDTFLSSLNTASLPVAAATGSGLLVGPVNVAPTNGQCGAPAGGTPSTFSTRFAFQVLQQSTAGDGKVVISNINYTTTADAANGPVLVRVSGVGGIPTVVQFQSTVSNATIGTTNVLGIAHTRLGVTQVGAFSISTKVPAVGKYVTYRFDFGVGAAGQLVQVWGATKTGNDWSAFTVVTSRRANASGVVYYYIRQNSATWKSYRAFYTGGGSWTPARQARWLNQ